MVTMEYDNTLIRVPQCWEDITLGKYESVYDKKPESARERVALVAQICEVDAEKLLSWPAEIFNGIVDYILFLYGDNPAIPCPYLEIDGVKYAVPLEDDLTLGAWVDADEAQKKGEAPISTTLAIVCRPVGEAYDYKNNEARQAMFAALPVSQVMGVMAFFLQCKEASVKLTQMYGNLQLVIDQLPRNTDILRSLGAGTKLLQMWRVLTFCILNVLLRYRLRKFLRSYNTSAIRRTQRKRKES